MYPVGDAHTDYAFQNYVESVSLSAVLAENLATPVYFVHHHFVQFYFILPSKRIGTSLRQRCHLLRRLSTGCGLLRRLEELDVGDHKVVHDLVVLLRALTRRLLKDICYVLSLQKRARATWL